MTSLKQEMRQKFETHSSMAFYENNSSFEEGLLEKIMNLAYASLAPFSSKRWDITAVGSPVLLQKLCKAVNDRRIAECAISLIICEHGHLQEKVSGYEGMQGSENKAVHEGWPQGGSGRHDLELLSLSIGYAAKYYCIDYFILKSFDCGNVTREFLLNRLHPSVIIGLGCFRNGIEPLPLVRNIYSDTVRFL